ncbi:hypothetical protein K461DRAFT_122949 [Myriangium duriaei CBS 260.36]|uniref:Uncharacterized protein n=1 Tax=Myriangium duriaei CBS 260.36 TaxID=1168546 RepID=A0A9P4MIB9_9PEZI|nr:hypothetical protein K461DRAFT_122949 [Myriangium duriaei CBS 260.36]
MHPGSEQPSNACKTEAVPWRSLNAPCPIGCRLVRLGALARTPSTNRDRPVRYLELTARYAPVSCYSSTTHAIAHTFSICLALADLPDIPLFLTVQTLLQIGNECQWIAQAAKPSRIVMSLATSTAYSLLQRRWQVQGAVKTPQFPSTAIVSRGINGGYQSIYLGLVPDNNFHNMVCHPTSNSRK